MFFQLLEIPFNYDGLDDSEVSPECEFIPSQKHSVSQDSDKKVLKIHLRTFSLY